MKNNLSIFLNVLLLIAVAVLFYLQFTSKRAIAEVKSKSDSTPKLTFSVPKNLAGARVLYVNIDTINYNYEAFADLSKEAGGNYAYLQKTYQKKALELQGRYDTYQQKVQMNSISSEDAVKEEAAINAGMEDLKKMETNIATLEGAAMEKNARITNDITTYFKSYSKDKGIDFILAYGGASNVLYANDSLDITKDVLGALNENYRKTKPASKIK
ncbi:MAG: OmpH family outer membrane protein [Bacteroidota bacterium]|nr:OmpH family outer membrane protein [Bacteroidota bacterium]